MTEPNFKKPRPKRKPSTSLLIQCDILCGKIVRARGVCEHPGCESTVVIQWAHGFSRSYRRIRHDERNGWALCRSHHMHFTHHPVEWDLWLHTKWGDDLYVELRDEAINYNGPRVDLKKTRDRLTVRAAELGVGGES